MQKHLNLTVNTNSKIIINSMLLQVFKIAYSLLKDMSSINLMMHILLKVTRHEILLNVKSYIVYEA